MAAPDAPAACLLHFGDERAAAARLAAACGLPALEIARHRVPDGELKLTRPVDAAGPLPARAVLRRSTPKSSTAMQPQTEKTAAFAGLMFSPMRRRVTTRAGEAIDLTGAEFNLLAAFVERANRVLSRDSIADLTRRDDWDAFDRSIDTLVSRLRRKLAPHVDASDLIQTVRGEGYVLAAEVRWSGQGEQVDGS